MPPRPTASLPIRGWKCPQCTARTFASSTTRQAFGPEHPRYIEVPEPPQPTLSYRPFIKGRLPVPRNILPGQDWERKASDAEIAKATPRPKKEKKAEPGSREEWKNKMSEARRRNLREGLKGLHARKTRTQQRELEVKRLEDIDKEERRTRPEREDERLTATSHGLDLAKLLHGPLEDPTREARLAHKARNVELHASAKRADRLDHLHTLYMNARTFIVTPEQLDEAIEEEFNKDFREIGTYAGQQGSEATSMWAYGPPMTVQDMLNRANRSGGRLATDGVTHYAEMNRERIKKIAEKLTGGKMEDQRT